MFHGRYLVCVLVGNYPCLGADSKLVPIELRLGYRVGVLFPTVDALIYDLEHDRAGVLKS